MPPNVLDFPIHYIHQYLGKYDILKLSFYDILVFLFLKEAVLDMDMGQQCHSHRYQAKGPERHKVEVLENVHDLLWVTVINPSDTHRKLKSIHTE